MQTVLLHLKLKVMDTKELEKLPNKDGEIEKGAAHIIVELIEYEHNNAVVSKSIMKKATGSINALSFASGEGLNEKTSPFDTYAQIIDGSAIIEIDGKASTLQTGDGILIPAHKPSHIKPNGRFKLILTVIKSGYE
jgi:quercetin dioxygenase-like cupin family protein